MSAAASMIRTWARGVSCGLLVAVLSILAAPQLALGQDDAGVGATDGGPRPDDAGRPGARARRDAGTPAPAPEEPGRDPSTESEPSTEADSALDEEPEGERATGARGLELATGSLGVDPDDAAADRPEPLDDETEALAAEPEAETPDAVAETPEEIEPPAEQQSEPDPAAQSQQDFLGALGEWFYERAEREEAARRAREQRPSEEPAPEATPRTEGLLDWVIIPLPERRVSTPALLVLLAGVWVLLIALTRLRKRLSERGFLPRVVGLTHLAGRGMLFLLLLLGLARLVPDWLRPGLWLALAAATVALGFSLWLLLPDLIATIVLAFENRVRPGTDLSADTAEGQITGVVERIGPRVTLLRLRGGARLALPNRRLLTASIRTSPATWPAVEVTLRPPAGVDPARLRAALRDAALCSPQIAPVPELSITRASDQPDLWRVRARVLTQDLTADFEGQLLERLEAFLAPPD